MVWLLFFLRSMLLVAVLYIPGILCLSGLELTNYVLIALAPSFSLVLLSASMTAASICNIAAGWPVYVFLLLLASVLGLYRNCSAINKRFVSAKAQWYLSPTLFYVLVSFVITMWIYVKTLNGPDSVIPLFDNASTLSMTRSMMNSNRFSPILSSNYSDTPSLDEGVSYYPGVFHSVSALLANMTCCGPAQALNVTIFISLSVILPLAVRSLIESCFPDKKLVVFCGAIAPLAFSAFPWNLISFGPLLTNLFSLASVPAFLSVLILLLDGEAPNQRGSLCLSLGLTCMALALSHPGALFTAGVIAIPLIVMKVYNCAQDLYGRKSSAFSAATICVVVVALIWVVCFNFPFLRPTVSFTWSAFMTPVEAFCKVITLSFADYQAQLVNVALVVVGACCCVRRGEKCTWLCFSVLLASALYLADVTMDGEIKQLLGGFWYTDSRRMAATIIIPLMPLLACGLSRVAEISKDYVCNQIDSVANPHIYSFCVAAIVAFSVFGPSIEVPGSFVLSSAMSHVRGTLESLNALWGNPKIDGSTEITMLDGEEVEAGAEIKAIVGDACVLNNALDGSSFLYGLCDIRTFYRSSSAQLDDEPYSLLRQHVNEYESNCEVRDLIERKQIKYVLQLDSGIKPSDKSTFYRIYNSGYWSGIQAINSSTPGFELVYERGDIRLYRLTDV